MHHILHVLDAHVGRAQAIDKTLNAVRILFLLVGCWWGEVGKGGRCWWTLWRVNATYKIGRCRGSCRLPQQPSIARRWRRMARLKDCVVVVVICPQALHLASAEFR